MIRLAISCDICGAEKRQTNHWFVACEVGGELRIGGWSARFRKKAGSRHLCGQTCLHKLVDEFMAKTIEEDRASADAGVIEAAAETQQPDPGPGSGPGGGPRNDVRLDSRIEPAYGVGIGMDQQVDHRLPDPRWIENRSGAARGYDNRPDSRPESRMSGRVVESPAAPAVAGSREGYEDEYGSSARLIATPEPVSERMPRAVEAGSDEASRRVSIPWRSTAWERERERGMRNEAGSRRRF